MESEAAAASPPPVVSGSGRARRVKRPWSPDDGDIVAAVTATSSSSSSSSSPSASASASAPAPAPAASARCKAKKAAAPSRKKPAKKKPGTTRVTSEDLDRQQAVEGKRRRWSEEEEAALRKGWEMYGKDLRSVWASIKRHPDLRDILVYRSNIDLKDKWRTMQRTHHGLPHNKGANGGKAGARGKAAAKNGKNGGAAAKKCGKNGVIRLKSGSKRRAGDAGTYIYSYDFGWGANGGASDGANGASSSSSLVDLHPEPPRKRFRKSSSRPAARVPTVAAQMTDGADDVDAPDHERSLLTQPLREDDEVVDVGINDGEGPPTPPTREVGVGAFIHGNGISGINGLHGINGIHALSIHGINGMSPDELVGGRPPSAAEAEEEAAAALAAAAAVDDVGASDDDSEGGEEDEDEDEVDVGVEHCVVGVRVGSRLGGEDSDEDPTPPTVSNVMGVLGGMGIDLGEVAAATEPGRRASDEHSVKGVEIWTPPVSPT